ncbi:hypothetical protein V8E54_003976 [Elaphomyces granulatus]
MDANGELAFLASREHPRSLNVRRTLLNPVLSPTFGEDLNNEENPAVDIVFILDACFSAHVTKSISGYMIARIVPPTGISRVVEVLAAVDAGEGALGNNPHRPKIQNRTFTAKLSAEVALARGRGASIEFSEVMTSLRASSPSKKPVHRILLGPNSVLRLPFSDSIYQTNSVGMVTT